MTIRDDQVVLFAPVGDAHADAVQRKLTERSVPVVRIDLAAIERPVSIAPGESLQVDETMIRPGATVWWRRSGLIPPDDSLGESENRLRAEEGEALLIGGLLALTDRWVDHPFTVAAAEHTLLQLATAARCGAAIPESLATNDPEAAGRAMAIGGPWIAKATSAGVGIAPFADYVTPDLVQLLPRCLTLLQRAQPASADVRVVLTGSRVLTWLRPRSIGEPLDWRAADAAGAGFELQEVDGVSRTALAINRALGLRFSVQDWLLIDDRPVFLEVNPSGQWLFLPDAGRLVVANLANLLTEEWAR